MLQMIVKFYTTMKFYEKLGNKLGWNTEIVLEILKWKWR